MSVQPILDPALLPKNTAADALDRLRSGDGHRDVIFATGFDPLDGALEGGLRSRTLTLVGGLPGIGKTILALQWARSLARQGHPVVFVSYEHDDSALLSRLLLLDAGEASRFGAGERRALLQRASTGEISFDEAVKRDPGLAKTQDRVAEYAERLWLIGGTSHTGLEEIEALAHDRDGVTPIVIVDYLQKLAHPDQSISNIDRVIDISEGLKDIALRLSTPVVAIVAAEHEGLTSRRLRMHHFRGSSALAFEADVVLILNNKFDVVSKLHTAFDSVRAESFKSQVVITIEKNRDGLAPLDLEFGKDFENYRFEPTGSFVSERLIDDHMFVE
ncbi:MAG: DnaB helicase C-terminal domain-containing protein [Acidimicrobiia bacterium]|nr:DnaB helicase C-terminal domain-containing protein [Acidimicrobiia bacterium]